MRNLILACMLAVSATQGDIVVQPEDPWEYDSNKAPYDVDLLGAYNGVDIKYHKIARRDSGFEWEFMEGKEGGVFVVGEVPDAWIKLPKPKLPKLVRGYTKEQIEQMLKEFDK